MKTAFKRVLSFLLAATLVFGTVGAEISGIDFADIFSFQAEAASGTCGDNLNWLLNTSTGVLNITGTGAMTDYTLFSAPWYSYRSSIKTVNIAEGVTTIGKYAFALCDSLTSVTIGNSVTTINYEAFYGCDGITSVTIGNSVISIGNRAFNSCDSLTSITVDENNKYYSSDSYGVLFNKDKTTLIQYPIGNARTSYTIPDSVTTIGSGAFALCDSLTSVTIPDSVTTINYEAFYGCDGITSVTFGENSQLKTIGSYAFRNCDSLTKVTIPGSVTTIDSYAFYSCGSLTSITVDENNKYYSSDSYGVLFNKDKTRLIQYPAGNTRTSYTIPDSVTKIGNDAFYDCDSLEYVHIPASVTSIGSSILSSTTAYICSDTEDCYAKTYADKNDIEFKLCDGHGVEVSCEHNYKKYTITATCTEHGYYLYVCTKCGEHYIEIIPMGEHSWELTESKPATCLEGGYEIYTCSACGETKATELPAKGHNFPADDAEYTEPTCTADGYWTVTCLDCDATHVIVDEGSAKGHSYDEGSVILENTCDKDGIIRYTCADCGHSYDDILPAAHKGTDGGKVTKPATCTEDGIKTYTCIGCGEQFTEKLSATGHDHEYKDNGNGTHTVTCTRCDYNVTENHKLKGRKCVCGYTNTSVISVLLIQDSAPWATTSNESLLNEFETEGYIDSWEKCTTAQAIESDLESYTIVVFANDQRTSAYQNLGKMKTQLENYTSNGGVFILGACDEGWGGSGSLTQTLPFGITTSNLYDYNNKVVDADHPIITGELTEGTVLKDSDLYHTYCSHTYFNSSTLPANTNVILKGTNNQPTLIEFTQGDGHIIVSGLTWEHNMVYRQTYAPIAFDDLLAYAISISDFGDNRHVVRFVDWDGTVLHTERVASGEAATAPANPTREGYTFTGWDKEFNNITEKTVVTAQYKINSYTVTVTCDENKGTATGGGTYDYATLITLEAAPADGCYFAGWFDGETLLSTSDIYIYSVPAKNVELTAVFAKEEIKLTSIAVNTLPEKTEYFKGNVLDKTGLTLKATYSDGSTAIIDSGFTCSPMVLNTAGKQTITVSYGGKTCTFNVTVKAVELVKIEVKTLPTKTEYFVGDTLNTTGLTLTATYNNGTTETITSGFTCSPTKLTTAGKQTITVSYGGKTCTFDVTVKAVELVKIEVKTLPTKTEYFVGDMLDTTGLTLTATYNNGTTETITSDFTCSPTKLTTAGKQTITVSYGGKTCTFQITVKAVELVKIEVKTLPTKTEYFVGDTLDTAGLTLKATYNNGTTETITTGYTCSPTKLNTAGKQTITVSYGSKTCTFDVTVKAVELVKIEVKTLPTKTEYFVGDTLDTAGLTLTATYNNGTTETITTGFTCSPTKLATAGKQTITVSYGGKTCTFDVTVKAVELVKIEVKTLPTKTEYFVGDTLDTTGLTLTATYNNGTTETITSDFTCSPTKLNTAGKQTITVTYGGKTCTFDVEVEQKDYSVTYMVNGKRYAKYIVTVGDPVPAPAVNPIVDGMIFEGWSPEIVQLMPANDLVYTAVFHKHVYTGSIAIHPTCTQHGVMLYTCSCGDSYNEIIPALGHDWGRWITVVEATPSSNGQKVRYCSRCGAAEYDVIPAPSANFRVEPIADQEYTGFGLYPAVKVYSLSGKRLDEYDHYEVSYENNINCGVATATVKGVGEYSGVIKVNFNIVKKDIANLSFAEIPDVTYSGDAYTPDPVIYYGDILLVKDVDYTVSYSANVNIGKATITITGIGNYTGTKVIYFNISKNSTSFSVPVVGSQVYTGKAVTPDFNLFSGDKLLIKGVDYTVTYENNINVGYGRIIIKGIGNYSGTIVVIFRIVSTQISLATVPSFSDIAYSGNEFTPDFNANPITYGGKKLVEGVDFKVEIYNNRNAGTVKIVIIGIGNFTGTIVIYVNINAVDISGVTVSRIDDVEYNGAAQTPSFKVTKNGKTLVKGVDYTVEYRNNIFVGTATVVIKGIGNYKGEKSFTFRIVEPTYYELVVTTESETLGYDSIMQVWAEINPYLERNYTFIYESSNAKIASVDENGVVKALDEGEVVITVTVVDEDGNPVLNPDGEEIRSEIRIRCTMTFWQKIIKFFRSIAAFFTNLFTFSIGLQMQ
ncbi:MAG: bacterial Ig-like domain-containing protein [Clostridia bacterium]|nr:bacterial Ig-like domain-containing protein [Clostridia bacterium]